MWSHELTLISKTFINDDLGNEIPTESRKIIFCDVKSISRNEFYNAANLGLKPTLVFVINSFEYDGEELIEFESKKYKVLRTYLVNTDTLELTCEKVIAYG